MKLLKGFLKTILITILIALGTILIILKVQKINTSYLNINNKNVQPSSYLITNVNIIPMTMDTVLTDHSLLIEEGIIKEIGPEIEADEYESIDAKNLFLSPGLIDMHVHLWDEQELGLYLANGITAIRNLWGIPFHLRLKKQIENKKLLAPMFVLASPKLTGVQDQGDDKVQISTPEEARKLIIQYKRRGFDCIKTYAGLPKEILDAVIDQSIQSDISIVSHPSREVAYLDQFHSQIVSLEHVEEIVQQPLKYQLDSSGLDPIINQFAITNTSFCPTLTGYYKIYEMLNFAADDLPANQSAFINPLMRKFDSEVQFSRWQNEKLNNSSVGNDIIQQHRFHLYIIRKMNEAGVNIICGTDAGIGITEPGFSIHQELKMYQESGLSNYDVLKTATINPSKTHRALHNTGSIEKDKVANFILTNENPLENLETLRAPEWVVLSGRRIERDQLDHYVEKAKSRKNFVATAIRYAEYLLKER